MPERTELLRRWSEVEPERCHWHEGHYNVHTAGRWWRIDGDEAVYDIEHFRGTGVDDYDLVTVRIPADMVLLAAVIEAAEARCMYPTLRKGTTGWWQAKIARSALRDINLRARTKRTELAKAKADAPDDAALSAYLEAVESTRAKAPGKVSLTGR